MIKSEFKNQNKLNNDYCVDSRAGLRLCQDICLQTKNLQGYIQEISEYPFGLMLLNEIQVKKNSYRIKLILYLKSHFMLFLSHIR